MTTVQTVLDALTALAPVSYKESWDNVGLLGGRSDRGVTRIMVALDPFRDVLEEAMDFGAQLVVSHHPLLFSAKSVTDRDEIGRTLLFLIEHHMSLICMHTNLDSAAGGVNDCLARALGLTDVSVLQPGGMDGQGREYGIGRIGTVDETSLSGFAAFVKSSLSCPGLRFVSAGKPVRRVGVCGGAGSEYMPRALELGCDTFVTGDVKYNGFWDAVDLGINLIDAGHFPTENVVCPYLRETLTVRFPEVDVRISKVHCDPVQFV